ncbi:transcriptional regulator [Kitasatospora acidiphila]|uniref:Transcriptional regulator n=1 Tax=Kitasatospora acidiphila TaxID=2567942 RepID=A0A540VYF1_9ACTN|nr:transcriptional regulator [Kitasatospora acidiphila]TQF01761.1 transcriptional regulator [Kitasatospora acidiphila]
MTQSVSPHATASDLLVLHALRCIGFSGLSGVAAATGLPESEVESELIDLAVAGLVTHLAGPFGGWGITDAGRAEDARRITEELDAADARALVTEAFSGFLVLNPELLDLCTAWQTRSIDGSTILNDHSDQAYDARVLERLADLDRRADAVCAELSAVMLRFQRYRTRLADALTRAKAGELDYVTDGTASYHTVWFHLHEDLLATLGRPRH